MTPSPTPSLAGQALELADTIVSDGCCAHWKEAVLLLRQFAAAIPALPPELATCTNSQTALIRDLIGALQEVLPYLDDGRSQQERELGADVRNLIRQAQRESQPAPTPDAAPVAVRYRNDGGRWRYLNYPFTKGWDFPPNLGTPRYLYEGPTPVAASMQASTTDAAQKPEQPQ